MVPRGVRGIGHSEHKLRGVVGYTGGDLPCGGSRRARKEVGSEWSYVRSLGSDLRVGMSGLVPESQPSRPETERE